MGRSLDRGGPPDGNELETVVEGGVEYAVHGGERYEIVKPPEKSRFDEYAPEQRRKIGEAYLLIAGLLPTEGRDYTVEFRFASPSANPTMTIRPMTPIGSAFSRHVANELRKRIAK